MFLLVLMCHLHHLMSSLPCTLDVPEVVVAAAILEDVAHLELDAALLIADKVPQTKGPGIVSTVDGVTTSLRSVGRSLVDLSGHNWLSLILLSLDTPQVPSYAHPASYGSSTVILSQVEYNRLRKLEFSQNSHLATHAFSSGMHAYIASPQKP